MDKLRELVFTALGEASMCWQFPPEGQFDSELAVQIGDELINKIQALPQWKEDTPAPNPGEKPQAAV